MAKPLGIPLGIDFASIDRDLGEVANRIEQGGKKIKLGVDMEGAGGAGVSDLGDRLATGIATGIRSSSSVMAAFAGRFDSMFDRFAGAAITTFERIDTAIKFPQFRAMLDRMSAGLMNFARDGQKGLTNMQLAAEGAFGPTAKIIADMASEMNLVNKNIGKSEASAKMLFDTVDKTAKAAQRFNMGTAGYKGMVPGPKIGARTQFTAPEAVEGPRSALASLGETARKVGMSIKTYLSDPRVLQQAQRDVEHIRASLEYLDRLPFRIGAGFAAMSIDTYTSLRRLGNFISSIGPVTKKTFSDMFNSMVRISTLGFVPNAIESAKKFNQTLLTSNTLVGRLTGSVSTLGTAILAAFGIVGVIYKAVQYLIGGVKAASDLNTAVERSKIVFGSSYGIVEEQAKRNNEQFRISKQEQLDMAAGFGAIAQGAGMSEQASAGFANQMTQMAADLKASGAAESFQEAGDAIKGGLTGRGMELKQLGAVMDEDAVKAYSLAKGYRAAGEEMGRQATLQTRAELVMRGLSFAQGALERNAGTSAEAFRKAGGGVQEFATQAGSLLLPAITTLAEAFNTLMGSALTFFETNKAAIASWAETIKGRVEFVGVVVRNLDVVWEMVQLQFGMHVENMIRWIGIIPPNFGRIIEWIRQNWLSMLADLGQMTQKAWENIFKNITAVGSAIGEYMVTGVFKVDWTPILDGFKATTEAFPEMLKPALVNVDGQMKELGDKMAAREADRLAGMGKAGEMPGKPGALPELEKDKKGSDYKLASAIEFNSKEAASVIARSQTAGAGKDTAKEHIKVAKDSSDTLKSIDNKLGAGSVKLVVK